MFKVRVYRLTDNSMRSKPCSGHSQRSIAGVHMMHKEGGAPPWPAVQAAVGSACWDPGFGIQCTSGVPPVQALHCSLLQHGCQCLR